MADILTLAMGLELNTVLFTPGRLAVLGPVRRVAKIEPSVNPAEE